jgi:hypothetical protein
MSCLQPPAQGINSLRRFCAVSEICLLLAFVLWMAWAVPAVAPVFRLYSGATLLTWIFGLTIMSHLSYGESLEDLGLGKRYFVQAFRELALPVGLLAILLMLLGFAFGTLHLNKKFFFQLLGIPFWALFQQYAAQSFINRRFQLIFGPGRLSSAMTAFIFAAIHLPNPALTIATAVAGYVWARAFQRTPSLYAIAFSHGLLSALFVNVMPKWILPNMVVGYNYLLK